MSRSDRTLTPTLVAAALALAVLFVGCSKPAPKAAATPEQVYTVRGEIASLPDPAKVGSGLQIRHERIPGYVNSKGETVGMESMTMSFTPAPGLDLSGLAPGDAVEFTWEMRWNPREERFSRVVRIAKLPTGTTLDFGAN